MLRATKKYRTTESEAYGPLAKTSENWRASLDSYFETAGGDPQEVVDAILELIETEPGQRPARVAVGQDIEFVTTLNASALAHQRAGLQAFGMHDFEHLVR